MLNLKRCYSIGSYTTRIYNKDVNYLEPKSKQKVGSFLNRYNYYSIRKFTIGTASILLGSTLIFGLSNEAQAQSEDGTHTSEQQVIEKSPPNVPSTEAITNETIKDNENVQGDLKPTTNTSKEKATTEPTVDSTSTTTTPLNQDSIQTPTETKTTRSNDNQDANTEDKNELTTQYKTTIQNSSDNNSQDKQSTNKNEANEERNTSNNSEQDLNESRAISTRSITREASNDTTTPSTREISEDSVDEIEVPQEFIDRYNNATDKSQLVHELLADSYDNEDVEEILQRVSIDYNSTSAKEAFKEIMYAGLQYAKEKSSMFSTYAVRSVGEGVNINNTEINSLEDLKRVIGIDPNSGLTINGDGITSSTQKPAHYTVHVQPNRRANRMNFTVTWKVDRSAGEA